MSSTLKDVANYYDQTLIHYKKWWDIEDSLSLHFGLWFEGTKEFKTALENTNREMAKLAEVRSGLHVLDAGSGAGGTARFLVNEFGCKVEGITISERQLELAKRSLSKFNHLVNFSIQNFEDTNFEDEQFDLVWSCESSCHAKSKIKFITECNRLLKPGGRVVIADYFRTTSGLQDKKKYLKKWGDLWAIEQFWDWPTLSNTLVQTGLKLKLRKNYTREITPSASRMAKKARWGMIGSEIYNLFNNTSKYAKHHYRSGFYQYKALNNGDWEYWIVVLEKTA